MELETFSILTIGYLFTCLIHYILNLKRKKNKYNNPSKFLLVFRLGILMYSLLLLILFFSNLKLFSREPEDLNLLFKMNGSMFCIFISVVFIALSMGKSRKFLIKLDFPSRSESHRGTIKLGKIVSENHKKHSYYLDLEDLTQHMFICGITGSGKSNLVQYFLLKFTRKHSLPFLLVEFKGEYQFLQERIPNLLILKPGENFSINMFNPEGADAQVHAERIFQIFESGGMFEGIEYSPQMERVFVDILNKVCGKHENRNWKRFQEICRYNMEHSKDSTLEKSIQAIENRIRRYNLGSLKKIFNTESMMDVRSLFNHNILLDLSSIIRLGGEKQDALFFLNMILKYLWDKNVSKGSKDYEGIRHITIIEDAQYFAPEKGREKVRLSTYLEDIALLLRGTGECLISLATRPNISREILANCGILACFQTHMQKEEMMELLNLKDWQKDYLSMLKKGTCIVRVNSIEFPFLLEVPHVKRRWLTKEEISQNNRRIIQNDLARGKNENEKEDEKPPISNKSFLKPGKKNYDVDNEVISSSNLEGDVNFYCKFCGKEIESNSEYCSECSTRLEAEDKEIEKLERFFAELVKSDNPESHQ